MGPGFRQDDIGGATERKTPKYVPGACVRVKMLTPYFPYIEIPRLFAPNVSSLPVRRNNLAAHETIFRFSRRRPETVAD
ncbi:hypothetical protein ACVJ19_003078 [Bradyrhizobium sp. USDA 376]